MRYDTIVIGLGASGVTAASTLAKAGRKVLALEAANRIGGRVKSVKCGDGFVEEGAEWIHGAETNCIYETALKNKINLLADSDDVKVVTSDGSKIDQDLFEDLFAFCGSVAFSTPSDNTILSMGNNITSSLYEYIKEQYPHLYKDKKFINEFLHLMNLFITNATSANDWEDVSSYNRYVPCGGEEQMSWHRYGYKTYFELMLNTYNNSSGLPNLEIKLNTEVKEIKWTKESRGNVEVITKDGNTFISDSVIVTVSLGVLKESYSTLFNPLLPQDKISAINKLSIGVMDKIILRFNKPWWPTMSGFKLFLWKTEDKEKISQNDYWTTKVMGVSVPMGASNVLTLWTSGDVAKLVEILPEDIVKRKLVELLQKFIAPLCVVPEPIEMIRSTWFANPLTRGCYSYSNLLTPHYPNIRTDLAAPLLDVSGKPRVLFAGEATHSEYFSTVHGASESGFREAKRLLGGSKI